MVLVIDDQADDILLIRRILEAQHSYRVIEASGGQAGIDLVHQRKPDVVILDLMMPEVDGFTVLEMLKREPNTRNIPVIVITAKELTEAGMTVCVLERGPWYKREDFALGDELIYKRRNFFWPTVELEPRTWRPNGNASAEILPTKTQTFSNATTRVFLETPAAYPESPQPRKRR